MSAGVFGRLLRASLGRLGGSWGPSWGLLAAPLRPWAAPGASWGLWAAPGCFLTASWRLLGVSGRLLERFGAPLGWSWERLGDFWAAPGGLLGRSGRLLGHCIKHRKNRVFYVFLGLRASPGGLWGDPGDLLAALGCVLGSPGPSWAGLGVSWTVLGGPVERPRAVGSRRAPRNSLHLKSKSRLRGQVLTNTSKLN